MCSVPPLQDLKRDHQSDTKEQRAIKLLLSQLHCKGSEHPSHPGVWGRRAAEDGFQQETSRAATPPLFRKVDELLAEQGWHAASLFAWGRQVRDNLHSGTGAPSSRQNRFVSQLLRENFAIPRLVELLPKESLLSIASFSLQIHPGKHPAPDLASTSSTQPGIKPGPV